MFHLQQMCLSGKVPPQVSESSETKLSEESESSTSSGRSLGVVIGLRSSSSATTATRDRSKTFSNFFFFCQIFLLLKGDVKSYFKIY